MLNLILNVNVEKFSNNLIKIMKILMIILKHINYINIYIILIIYINNRNYNNFVQTNHKKSFNNTFIQITQNLTRKQLY